jgi:hypothetical protein
VSTSQYLGLVGFGITLAVLVILYVCDQYTKRHKPNRRKGLPAPSKASTRYATPQAVP